MKRLYLVLILALFLSGCARRYIIIMDNSLDQRSTKTVIVDQKEKPKMRVITFGVNFVPRYYPPMFLPLNQSCLVRPVWFYY